ncbi:polysaccharide lyase family 8 super-sandwich domain-containing protein [Neobacillus drentensis]|uniref:polysaccharide lyase family 8 super-sandwich domain-containing protein n=1 Tax=Neobacillus drentensis TaxID=220684 RepID=UPI002FFE33BC
MDNGGFENTITTNRNKWSNNIEPAGWSEWFASGSPKATVDHEVYHEGNKSVRLEAETTSRVALTTTVQVKAGQNYALSTWIKTKDIVSDNGIFIRTQYLDSEGKKIGDGPKTEKIIGTNDWGLKEIFFTVPQNVSKIKIEPFFETGTGTAWLDDIKLVEWSGATNLTLDQSFVSVEKDKSITLTPIFTPENIQDKTVVWSSSDVNVVTVENGIITGKNYGIATIKAATRDGRFMAESQVSVESLETMKAFDTLRKKWFNKLTGGAEVDPMDSNIAGYISDLTKRVTNNEKTGIWDTMDKSINRTFLWSDRASTTDPYHIVYSYGRLKDMALAYSIKGSSVYQNETLKNDITSALDWLYVNRYNENQKEYGNWYVWEIAIPQTLNDLIVLMYDDLTETQRNNYIRAIDSFVPDPTKRISHSQEDFRETGANLLDKAHAVTLRGVLGESSTKIEQGKDAIGPEFAYVDHGDGVYRDGSVVQHFNVAYTGGYGATWINRAADMTYLLNSSPWHITDPNVNNVYDWVTDSFDPVIYKGSMMDMVNGRGISRKGGGSAAGVVLSILRLADGAPPEKSDLIKSLVKEWIQSDSKNDYFRGISIYEMNLVKALMNDDSLERRGELVKHQVFAGMDRIVHHRPKFSFGVSMFSDRISAFEYGNQENSKGLYTGLGMTYLYNDDHNQYSDHYWPTIDMFRLPGTTTDRSGEGITPKAWHGYMNTQTWVGGSSMDDLYGTAGMDFSLSKVSGSTLSGKKSWFSFDDEIVALGAGIKSADDPKVETIIENRKLNEDANNTLTINGETKPNRLGWSETLEDVRWAHLTGNVTGSDIGYYFPESAQVYGLREARTGSWYDINQLEGSKTPETRNYLSLAIEHGVKPSDASYSYVMLPDKDAAATKRYSDQPNVSILSNTPDVHAVREKTLGITAANFWKPGTVDFITAQDPSSVMVKEMEGELTLAVSDPTQKQDTILIELNKAGMSVVSTDTTVKVVQTSPTIKVEVNVSNSIGRTHVVKFKDTTGPVVKALDSLTFWQTESEEIHFDISDSGSGIANIEIKLDGKNMAYPITLDALLLSVGNHIVEVTAVDHAGNATKQQFMLTVKIDVDHLDEVLKVASEKGWLSHHGIFNSLMKKIEHIQRKETSKQLLNGLKALQNEIQTQSDKKINKEFAKLFLDDITYLKNQVSTEPPLN